MQEKIEKTFRLLRMCIFFCNFARYFEMNEQFQHD